MNPSLHDGNVPARPLACLAFRGSMQPGKAEPEHQTPQIKVDVHEDDGGYTVKAEIPGERRYGYASRGLMFASDVGSGRAEARDDNGVLGLRLPRRSGVASWKVAIS